MKSAGWRAVAGICLAAAAFGRFQGGQEASSDIPAFPGAEGFGAAATGGRGGRVIKVTNLNPTGPGSFQAALDTPGPRIVVFEVSGVIPASHQSGGKRYFTVGDSNLTIAGQTAPGGGITLDGTLSFFRGGKEIRNIIVRFIRIRTGSDEKRCYLGRANIRALEASGAQLLIVDHVSGAWSLDDCFDLYTARDVTVQWCTIEESDIVLEGGDEPHNFGLITGWAGGGPRPISIHHTLIAHHRERTPCVGSFPTDFRNNVIYNAGSPTIFLFLDKSGKYKAEDFTLNLVGNYLKPGPGGLIGTRVYMPPTTLAPSIFQPPKSGRIHVRGNYQEYRYGLAEPWKNEPQCVPAEHAFAPVTTQVAEEAYELVLASSGCLPRDAITLRTIAEVQTGTGYWGRRGPAGGLMEGLTPGTPPLDSDNDGMPDEWEKAHGLDSQNPDDANKVVPEGASPGNRHRGYTYIEYYINNLADELVAEALTKMRLDRTGPQPWNRPARELARGAKIHETLDDMVQTIREQRSDRHPVTDTHAAWFAIQQLERMGDAAAPAIPELTTLLESPDPRTTSFAAWALGAIGPAAADAVPALIKVVERKSDTGGGKWVFNERGFAAWALGRIGAPAATSAVQSLAQLVESGDSRACTAALWALSRLGKACAPAKDILLRHLDRDHAPETIAGLGSSVVPDLIRLLRGEKLEIRAASARALGLIGTEAGDALPALISMTADPDPYLRATATRALGCIPATADSVSALAKLLADPELPVRHAAAVALRNLGAGAVAAIPSLEAAFSDSAPEIRRAACLALAHIGRAAIPVLARALRHKDEIVRRNSARALGIIGPEAGDTVPELGRMLTSDQDAWCRREAVWALTLINPDRARRALRQVSEDEDYVVRHAAKKALGAQQ